MPIPVFAFEQLTFGETLETEGIISTVLDLPSRINSTRLAPAAGDVLKPVPLNPQAR
jgi:hypothetical protein